jgi:hypothetical protein
MLANELNVRTQVIEQLEHAISETAPTLERVEGEIANYKEQIKLQQESIAKLQQENLTVAAHSNFVKAFQLSKERSQKSPATGRIPLTKDQAKLTKEVWLFVSTLRILTDHLLPGECAHTEETH